MELVASRVTVAGGEVGGLDPVVSPQRPGVRAVTALPGRETGPVGGVSREQYGEGHRGGRGVGL
jgi:hypothetical protein